MNEIKCSVQPSNRHTFLKGLISGSGVQIIVIALALISVPMGLNYLGAMQYGLWMVISSLVAYLGLSQFGIGTAAATLIAKADGSSTQLHIFHQSLRLLICSGGIAFILFLIAAVFPGTWSQVFGRVSELVKEDAVHAAIVTVLAYIIRLPTVAFTSGFVGLRKVHWEKFYGVLLPSFFSFVALLLTIHFAGSLVMLAYLTGAAQILSGALAGLHFCVCEMNIFRHSPDHARDKEIRNSLLDSGSRFFFIGIAAMIVWYTDNLVISYFLGPESVTAYSVTFKLFSTAFSLMILTNSVLMPMFGNAFGQKNWQWINETYRNVSLVMVIAGGLIWIGGLLFTKPILSLWTGSLGYAGGLAVFSLGGYGYVLAFINLNANLLSSMNATQTMLRAGVAEAGVNLVLSIIFIHWWGIGGVAFATFISASITVFWMLGQDIKKKTANQVNSEPKRLLKHFVLIVMPSVITAYLMSIVFDGITVSALGAVLCGLYLYFSWRFLPNTMRQMVITIFQKKLPLSRQD